MNSGALWAVIIILVGVVGWIAYTQGFLTGQKAEQEDAGITIDLGGGQE